MKELQHNKVILWDFDGVIMDSMPIRSKGFEEVLKRYPSEQVEALLQFHEENGGLSRYLKFRYFFEEIRKEEISEDQVQEFATAFSEIMLGLLINEELLINDSLDFIRNNYTRFSMHIVSGSDQKELRKICEALNLSPYFKSIHGSPVHKNILVQQIIETNGYDKASVVMIGDSKNDKEASEVNGIAFCGYNSESLNVEEVNYIESFSGIII